MELITLKHTPILIKFDSLSFTLSTHLVLVLNLFLVYQRVHIKRPHHLHPFTYLLQRLPVLPPRLHQRQHRFSTLLSLLPSTLLAASSSTLLGERRTAWASLPPARASSSWRPPCQPSPHWCRRCQPQRPPLILATAIRGFLRSSSEGSLRLIFAVQGVGWGQVCPREVACGCRSVACLERAHWRWGHHWGLVSCSPQAWCPLADTLTKLRGCWKRRGRKLLRLVPRIKQCWWRYFSFFAYLFCWKRAYWNPF